MSDTFFKPVSGMEMPRFAGIPTFMRLPCLTGDHPRIGDVQIGLVGLPWDGAVTNRPGARHGPRQLRDYSTMIRAQHPVTGLRPFETANCADLGSGALQHGLFDVGDHHFQALLDQPFGDALANAGQRYQAGSTLGLANRYHALLLAPV